LNGDLDDLAEPFVGLGRPVVLQRRGDRLGLADGAEVGPGRRDVAGLQQAAADAADRLDVALPRTATGPARQVRQLAGLDQGRPSS
jgi:hypothetical protein